MFNTLNFIHVQFDCDDRAVRIISGLVEYWNQSQNANRYNRDHRSLIIYNIQKYIELNDMYLEDFLNLYIQNDSSIPPFIMGFLQSASHKYANKVVSNPYWMESIDNKRESWKKQKKLILYLCIYIIYRCYQTHHLLFHLN